MERKDQRISLRLPSFSPFRRFPLSPLSNPHQHLAVFIHSQLFDLDKFFLQGVEHVGGQVEL